jgi:hypothetical protein
MNHRHVCAGDQFSYATHQVTPPQRNYPFIDRRGCLRRLWLFFSGLFAWLLSFLEEIFLKCKSMQGYLAIWWKQCLIDWSYLLIFHLQVSHTCVGHQTFMEDPSHPRQMPGQQHGNLKSVTIFGFCYAKSLVELTCYIIENAATSLESLTLDIHGTRAVSVSGAILRPMYDGKLVEAPRTLLAIRTYIQRRIPSTVKLNVLEPCGTCSSSVGH